MINSVFYYIFACSIILYYGVGMNRLLILKKDYVSFFKSILKAYLITGCTVSISYFAIRFALAPLSLTELYPYISAFSFLLISIPLHMFIRTGTADLAEDYAVPFLTILISLNEGESFFSALIISASCITAFYLFLLIIFAFRRRFKLYTTEEGLKPYALLLISIAVVIIALFCWNVSWLSIGINSNF